MVSRESQKLEIAGSIPVPGMALTLPVEQEREPLTL